MDSVVVRRAGDQGAAAPLVAAWLLAEFADATCEVVVEGTDVVVTAPGCRDVVRGALEEPRFDGWRTT